MKALTITIYEASEGGYLYDIYDTELEQTARLIESGQNDSLDGGLCTTTLLNALGMATQQAEALIKRG